VSVNTAAPFAGTATRLGMRLARLRYHSRNAPGRAFPDERAQETQLAANFLAVALDWDEPTFEAALKQAAKGIIDAAGVRLSADQLWRLIDVIPKDEEHPWVESAG
jgi:hypothetical protein